MKRFLSLFLALVLLLGVIPSAAAADFTDVPENSWYRDAVQYAVNMGLMNGISDSQFAPETSMSRAMLVTVLWRYAGSPKEGTNNFNDVTNGLWYTDAIAWAAENGVVTGVGNGKFDPDGSVTREQLAVVLYRYSNAEGIDTSGRKSLDSFPDATKVSPWAADALSWAVAVGMINGIGSGSQTSLAPQGSATRAQVAAILMRYILNVCNAGCAHSKSIIVNEVAPTCTTDGYSGDVICATCGYMLSQGKTLSKLYHDYDANGVCINCGLRANAESIDVAGKTYSLGMTKAELIALAGKPDEIFSATAGYAWYVFGSDDYQDFFMSGVYEDTVVSLCATGVGFTYLGRGMGDEMPEVTGNECRMQLCIDSNDNNIFYAVQLTDMSYSGQSVYDEDALWGEGMANFHLTNAFRVYHGESILDWSGPATTSARLHSQDMADNDYFSHYSQDGRNPGDRMLEQAISWRGWAENICAGYRSGFEAYDCWVNSEGHRSNMLADFLEFLGVGFAVNSDSTYFIYATQNFYSD